MTRGPTANAAAGHAVAVVNARTWAGGDFVGDYANRTLRPVETLLMTMFAEELRGQVLELGCGAGRLTGYLAAIASSVDAIDLSPRMLAECNRRYPGLSLHQGDVSDLSRFADARFSAVVAGYNLLDVFSDRERRSVLGQVARVLAPGGVLIMSAHNRAFLPSVRRPWQLPRLRLRGDLRQGVLVPIAAAVRLPRRYAHHRRLRDLEITTRGYALVNDEAHEFSLVHYYTSWDLQFRQFQEEGLEPVLALDLEGHPLGPDYAAPHCPEIHYVGRRRLKV